MGHFLEQVVQRYPLNYCAFRGSFAHNRKIAARTMHPFRRQGERIQDRQAGQEL